MFRIIYALLLITSIYFITSCKNDPINSNFGSEQNGTGEFKTITIPNVTYENFLEDSVEVLYNVGLGTHLTLMNKLGVESRIALIANIKTDVNHHVAELYLESDSYVGDDFGSTECNVYYINDDWFDEYNQDPRWEDYTSMIDSDPIGTFTITSSDTTTDTLKISNLEFWNQMSDTSSIPKNYGILIDLPESISESYIKNYKALASGTIPQYHYQYKYVDDADTNLYGNTSNIIGNHNIIDDQSDEYFTDTDNYYYIKTFTPSHLLLNVPFDSIKNILAEESVFLIGAYLQVPIDTSASYYESAFFESLYMYPADTTQTERVTYNSEYGNLGIGLTSTIIDSIQNVVYRYNSATSSQEQLASNVFKAGLQDTVFQNGWLIEPGRFDRYFTVYAIPKNVAPKLVLKYYKREDTRF